MKQYLPPDGSRRLADFCEWTLDKRELGNGKPALKAEMWFRVTDQPVFAVAGFWQTTAPGCGFIMVICDPNELVAPIQPKAMITILRPEDCETWLHGSYDNIAMFQRPYDDHLVRVAGLRFPTRHVNTTDHRTFYK